jgi:carbonic anhydrase
MRHLIRASAIVLISAAPAAAQTVCATPGTPGREQSPVNIRSAVLSPEQRLESAYPPLDGEAVHTGHTLQVNVPAGDSLIIDGKVFKLVQYHFHHPGEHRRGAEHYPAELHMVHQAADGSLAVLGTWIRTGEQNHAWDAFFANLPTPRRHVPARVHIDSLFGTGPDLNREVIYRYCGSLTSGTREPYQEGVTWLMRAQSISMSAGQLAALRHAMHRYSRNVQPLNERVIVYRRP